MFRKKNQEERQEELIEKEGAGAAFDQGQRNMPGREDDIEPGQDPGEEQNEEYQSGNGESRAEDEEQTGEEEWSWEREKEELLDTIKRKQAEMDNLRRINKMEQAEARDYALYDFLCRLLPVMDNLERALDSARADDDVPESFTSGLEMIYRQLLQVMEQEGVSTIEASGQPFDPHCHHAVMQVESEEDKPGHVVEELQKGYRHRKRILRPAMVKVCGE